MQIITGKKSRPRRIILCGPHGIGKSTWAADSPSPIFAQTEDGLDDIGVDRTPLIESYEEYCVIVENLHRPHNYSTFVVDTIDWLERLIHQRVAIDAKVKSIDEIGYYRGYLTAIRHWNDVLKGLNSLRNNRNMAIILLAHAKEAKIEPPDAESYNRYEPDLHKHVAPLLQEWADEVLFANYKVNAIQKNEGFERKRYIAVGGDRVIYTCEKPSHLAKRRIAMPDEIPMQWAAYADCITKAYAENGYGQNINGVVVDGHSKPKENADV